MAVSDTGNGVGYSSKVEYSSNVGYGSNVGKINYTDNCSIFSTRSIYQIVENCKERVAGIELCMLYIP